MFYEREARANGLIEHRHYVSAGGATFALHVKREGNTNGAAASAVQYFHQDNLGSIAMISDASGAVVERLAYDPWGKRRGANGTADSMDGMTSNVTRRGYTEHEHIDEMGLVNMNGRIYDPLIARFISADPFIQSPLESQSYNRYAYVMNQPMNRTDPTGYFSFGKIFVGHMKAGDKVGAAVFSHFMTPVTLPFGRGFSTNYHTAYTFLAGPNGYQIKSFAIGIVSIFCYAGAPACYAGMTYALNRGYGDGHHAATKKAAAAGVSKYLESVTGDGTVERYSSRAFTGCVSAVANGAKCGQGARAAVAGMFVSDVLGGGGSSSTSGQLASAAVAIIAGGISERISGGKFNNGARTAAMAYLFSSGGGYADGLTDESSGALVSGGLDSCEDCGSMDGLVPVAGPTGAGYGGQPYVPNDQLPTSARFILQNRTIDPFTGMVNLETPPGYTMILAPRGDGFLLIGPGWTEGDNRNVIRVQPPGTGSSNQWGYTTGYYVVTDNAGATISIYSGQPFKDTNPAVHNPLGAVTPPGTRRRPGI